MRAKRKKLSQIGTCLWCGAAIFNVAGPTEFPRARHTCDCRWAAIYHQPEQTIIVQPPTIAPAPVVPRWTPQPGWGTGDPLPPWPNITCGSDNAEDVFQQRGIPILVVN